MPDLSKLDWPTIGAVLVGVLALIGTISAARIARDSDRAIRSRIAKDVAVWKELPPGSQPRKQMFDLIGRQVDALTAPRKVLGADGFVLVLIAIGFTAASAAFLMDLGRIVRGLYDPFRWMSPDPTPQVTPDATSIAMSVATGFALLLMLLAAVFLWWSILRQLVPVLWKNARRRRIGL